MTVFATPHGTHVDERDVDIMRARMALLDGMEAIRCGDYVRFPDGHYERVSHVWEDGVQTSNGGSWYLGNGYCSFSGGLNAVVSNDTLTLTDEIKPGMVWFFHHDYAGAGNGVDVIVPLRVYVTTHERIDGEWK